MQSQPHDKTAHAEVGEGGEREREREKTKPVEKKKKRRWHTQEEQRKFFYEASVLWISLPKSFRHLNSKSALKSALKTHLFPPK